jgi:hypothetical protein
MTPEQCVEEYCDEYAQHGFGHSDYIDLLDRFVFLEPLREARQLARIISAYDPMTTAGGQRGRADRASYAFTLLSSIDQSVMRLRALPEGRQIIQAARSLLQRMQTAHFDKDPENEKECQEKRQYEILVDGLKGLDGINSADLAIQDTLKVRYEIRLSAGELGRFVDYLISEDPSYPRWSGRELYRHPTEVNSAGFNLQYLLMKNGTPFYDAYLRFTSRK